MKYVLQKVVGIAVLFAVLVPAIKVDARTTPVDQLPTPLQVTQTAAELEELGCHLVSEKNGNVDTPDEITYRVETTDQQAGQHAFCGQNVLPLLTQANGQVAGLTSEASAAEGLQCLTFLTPQFRTPGEAWTQFINCAREGGPIGEIDEIPEAAARQAGKTVINILNGIVLAFAGIGFFLLWAGVSLVNFALSPTQFATHDIVQEMWPFVLGVANLGFILALLAIAFGTVLQIQDFAVRRMLPRLLFAALLINFSLLLGTLVVDASRLAMAIELQVLNAGRAVNDVTTVGSYILGSSRLHEAFDAAIINAGGNLSPLEYGSAQGLSDSWTGLTKTLFASILIWGTAIGFLIIGVMLVVRYIAILLLLILSPLAFLFIAIPRAGQLANRWWQEFLKYVLYGPAVLLILIILMRALEIGDNFFGRQLQGAPDTVYWFSLITTVSITIILLYMAAVAGRYLGLAGAAATVGFVSGKAKQAARLYGRGASAPARYIGRGVRNQIRDVSNVARSKTRDVLKARPATKWLVPAKRDEKGNLKPGEESFVSKSAKKIIGPRGADRDEYNAAKSLGAITVANVGDDAIRPQMLRKGHVTDGLGTDNIINNLVGQHGDRQQVSALINNKDFLRGMNDQQKINFQANITARGFTNTDRLIDQFQNKLDEIDKESK